MRVERPDLEGLDPAVRAYIESLEAELDALRGEAGEESELAVFQEPPTTLNVITISTAGVAKRTPRHLYTRQRRGGGVMRPREYFCRTIEVRTGNAPWFPKKPAAAALRIWDKDILLPDVHALRISIVRETKKGPFDCVYTEEVVFRANRRQARAIGKALLAWGEG